MKNENGHFFFYNFLFTFNEANRHTYRLFIFAKNKKKPNLVTFILVLRAEKSLMIFSKFKSKISPRVMCGVTLRAFSENY